MKVSKKTTIYNTLASSLIAFGLGTLLLSCATKKDTEFIDVSSDNVEKSLGLNDEKIKKFKISSSEETDKSDSSKKSTINKKKPAVKKSKQDGGDGGKDDVQGSHQDKPIPKEESKAVKQKEREVKKETFETIDVEEGEIEEDDSLDAYPEEFAGYDKTSQEVWPQSKPIIDIGERFVFKVSYLGITAGHIKMETMKPAKMNGENLYHFTAKLRSARYYSYIYTLDDSLDSYVTQDSFIPVKYVLTQRESSQVVDDLQLFDREELKTYHWYKRIKEEKLKKVELTKHIPYYFQDSFSALHFVRSLPLVKGDNYEYPIVTRGKIWILKIKVEEVETIEVMDEDVKAIRINAETHFPGVLEKKGDIYFWFSADEKKKLLKFEAQVKIGSVAGELVEYKAGKPL